VSLLGLATLGVGIWLIATQGSKNTACNASLGKQLGMGPVCSRIVFSYFGGFGLIGAGVILLGIAAILMKRKNMRSKRGKIMLQSERRQTTQTYPTGTMRLTSDRDRERPETP
jgi:phage shock protein PspC (stress-responsive transcriptional regulator)